MVKKRRLDSPNRGQEIAVTSIKDMDENTDPNNRRKRQVKSTPKAVERNIRRTLKSKEQLSIESPDAKCNQLGRDNYYSVSAANSDVKMKRSGSDAKHCSDGVNDLSVSRARASFSLSLRQQMKKSNSDLKSAAKSKMKYGNIKIR